MAPAAVAVVVGRDGDPASARAVVTIADVDRREASLRSSPAAARLPRAGTAEGRQLRRWIAHSLAAQAIVETEPLPARPAGSGDVDGPALPGAVGDALGAGSIALAVLSSSPAARQFAGRLTADVRVPADVSARLAAADPVRATRRASHLVDGREVNGGRPVTLSVAELPRELAEQLPTAPAGAVLTGTDSAGRTHAVTLLDAAPAAVGNPAVPADAALTRARARVFGRWLDERRDALVHPRPGYEHPADPRQPDNTHRH